MRVIGDLTLEPHRRSARVVRARAADPDAPERGFYYFDERCRTATSRGSASATLPKLDWRLGGARRRMAGVVRQLARAPTASTAGGSTSRTWPGRYRGVDLTREVARVRPRAQRPDALLVAEHAHDFRADLDGGGWHGTMNYAGFMRPVWSWLRGDDRRRSSQHLLGLPGRPAALRRRGRRSRDARVPRGRAVAVDAPLVDAARQPRHARASAPSPARASGSSSGSACR